MTAPEPSGAVRAAVARVSDADLRLLRDALHEAAAGTQNDDLRPGYELALTAVLDEITRRRDATFRSPLRVVDDAGHWSDDVANAWIAVGEPIDPADVTPVTPEQFIDPIRHAATLGGKANPRSAEDALQRRLLDVTLQRDDALADRDELLALIPRGAVVGDCTMTERRDPDGTLTAIDVAWSRPDANCALVARTLLDDIAARTVEDAQTIATLRRGRADLAIELDRLDEWQNDLAGRIPEEFDDDAAQEAIITRWVDHILAEHDRLRGLLRDRERDVDDLQTRLAAAEDDLRGFRSALAADAVEHQRIAGDLDDAHTLLREVVDVYDNDARDLGAARLDALVARIREALT